MTYTIVIDQEFAKSNDLTLTEVSALSAFMTLPIWTKTLSLDGKVWYMYSDEKMSEDFPLLFGEPKRCYKNVRNLEERGFVELTKVGKCKYVRFTERCADWNKEKDRNRTESPKTDSKKSKNGLNDCKKSPKTDSNYNINILTNNIRTKDIAEPVGYQSHSSESQENESSIVLLNAQELRKETCAKEKKDTTENLCLFANSRYNDFTTFCEQFKAPEFANVDLSYYFNAVSDWSAQGAKKKHDWIATARNFMRSDRNANKLRTKNEAFTREEMFRQLADLEIQKLKEERGR